MLLLLTQWLAEDIRAFNVFNYITLRAVLATLTALLISFVVGPAMIRKLTAYKIGQSVRDDGPKTPSEQGRHADHGRRVDPGFDHHHHAVVGGSAQPLRVGGAGGDAGFRHGRLGG